MSKTVLNWISRKNLAGLLILFLPILVFLCNILAWFFSRLAPADSMMPISYRLLLLKE